MVDVRIPERDMNDRAIVRLSAAARHDYWSLLLLSTAMRSDGSIEAEDLPMIPWGVNGSTFGELERHGLLDRTGPKAWVLTRFQSTQTAAKELDAMEAVRNYERVKKARTRAKAAGMDDAEIDRRFPLVTGDSPRAVRGHAEDRTGQARPGQDQGEASAGDEAVPEGVDSGTGEIRGWATVQPGRRRVEEAPEDGAPVDGSVLFDPGRPYAGEGLEPAA